MSYSEEIKRFYSSDSLCVIVHSEKEEKMFECRLNSFVERALATSFQARKRTNTERHFSTGISNDKTN